MKKVITFFLSFSFRGRWLQFRFGTTGSFPETWAARKDFETRRLKKFNFSFELKWLFLISNDDVIASLDRDAVLRDADRRVVARPLSRQLHLRRRQPDRDVHPGGTRSDAQHAQPQTSDHRLQVQQLPHDRRLTKVNLTCSALILPSYCPSHLKVPTELILPSCSLLS